ncbi:uncharacterized protein HD556DRAFT_1446460 [Suillus plorans]|uniref:JmjC domain-containing protein n=1 Tax=Suillus plorans TaxID=116603 RepID=A0A9P7AI83_9AGAM|nr:uncharacterized protein HD556DRAFT_1446460 [Suillus plorans]KAG1790108.1 hypothetical protein HD556DRAFT_1446460 [Suillus plorans]
MPFKSELDLTIGVIGTNVPRSSPCITWKNGHKTVLPAVHNEFMLNLCDHVDIPLIRYMAQLNTCESTSNNVLHLSGDTLQNLDVMAIVSDALSTNRCVKVTGVPYDKPQDDITTDYLDEHFSISPLRPVSIHDTEARYNDHADPIVFGNIKSFIESINDPTKIQSILDIPLAQTALPKYLRQIHPQNFTSKGWGLLSHAGFLSYPHHDAEGTLTWIRIESGIKFWAIFHLKGGSSDRIQLQHLSVRLADYNTHKEWILNHCDGEVIALHPGDMLILPPGIVHAVYTPVPSFCTGGHFYNYSCMHLTELSRYVDAEVARTSTNQDMEHALETLRRMVIALPYLSGRKVLHKRSLLSLCVMATKRLHYRAQGGSNECVEETETAKPCADIADIAFKFLGVSNRKRPGDILYKGDQFDPGQVIDRVALLTQFKLKLDL